MTKEEFFNLIERYFALSPKETEQLFNDEKFRDEWTRRRLLAMVETIKPYCDQFITETDEKLKRKVGKVFLQKLDYSQFYDSVENMRRRLSNLFSDTTAKGINPYKIVYCSVLTDGNLKRDNDANTKYYDTTRDFKSIYDSLQKTLDLTDSETVEIFEKCSSLIAKGYAYKFPHIYNKLKELIVYDDRSAFYALRPSEVVDILKINPSLFVMSTDRIQDSFNYIQNKMKPVWDYYAEREIAKNPNMTKLGYRLIMTRKWLKNNSSLLTLSSSTMNSKERYLSDVNYLTDYVYEKQFKRYFKSPVGLATMNQIPYDYITKNAEKNIRILEEITSQENVAKYLESNPYMIGMNSVKFENLIKEIVKIDKENPEEKLFDRFLELGKTLFASNIDFSVNKIIDNLQKSSNLQTINVEKLTEEETLKKFMEVFFEKQPEMLGKIEDLILEKQKRNFAGERRLRSHIRNIGDRIVGLPRILKDDRYSTAEKRDTILTLAKNVEALHEQRYSLASVEVGDVAVVSIEKENSKKIEDTLNLIRNVYEQKHFKVGKKYSNVEQLFEKTMDYLSSCFDDKESLSDLFRTSIIKNFDKFIKTTYETESASQQQLFGEVLVVKGVDSRIVKPLEKLDKQVKKTNLLVNNDDTTFIFEK